MREALATLDLPTLVIAGDEDERALQPGLMLKRTLPRAGLAVLPGPATSPISKSRSCSTGSWSGFSLRSTTSPA